MKPWMLAAMSGTPDPIKLTYLENTTVTIPIGVTNLAELVGAGQPGQPEYTGTWGYQLTVVTKFFRPDGTPNGSVTSVYPAVYSEHPPSESYCETSPAENGNTKETCYNYDTFNNYTPPTTGANATGFGKTFPGGSGGPASPVPYKNVPVAPGQPYELVIPPGGSITISYYL